MFITLEGPEGGGKTSQVLPLIEYLRQEGYDVLGTREPGGTSIGEQIREVLSNLDNTEMVPSTEILLFQASRAQLVEQVIRPHLAKGGVVLCDRYADSTLAYQGYGHQMDLVALRSLIQFATGGLQPDLTILLDLDVSIGLQRRAKAGGMNRLDTMTTTFHERVRQGYLNLAHSEPQRWQILDANQPAESVQLAIRDVVMARLRRLTPS